MIVRPASEECHALLHAEEAATLTRARLEELLRVRVTNSPVAAQQRVAKRHVLVLSAEVQGHGPGQEVLQLGKQDVNISRIEPVGHYALRLVFDDNHDTGIYSWEYLYYLGTDYEEKWQTYLDRLAEAGHERKTD